MIKLQDKRNNLNWLKAKGKKEKKNSPTWNTWWRFSEDTHVTLRPEAKRRFSGSVPSDSLWRSGVAKTQRRPINTSERIDAEKKAAATRAESRGRPGRAVAARKHAGAERNFVQVGGSCSPRKSRERRVTERTGFYSVCPRPSVKQTSPTLVCASPSHFLSTFPRSTFPSDVSPQCLEGLVDGTCSPSRHPVVTRLPSDLQLILYTVYDSFSSKLELMHALSGWERLNWVWSSGNTKCDHVVREYNRGLNWPDLCRRFTTVVLGCVQRRDETLRCVSEWDQIYVWIRCFGVQG